MARQSIVGDKSLAFAKRIAKLYRFLVDKKKETKQLCLNKFFDQELA